MQVEVDLARLRRPATLDVDVGPVENRHVDGEPGGVTERLQVRDRDLADVHRVDRCEAEVEHARELADADRRPVGAEGRIARPRSSLGGSSPLAGNEAGAGS